MSKRKVAGKKETAKKLFTGMWRAKWLGDDCPTLGEVAKSLRAEADRLDEMHADGVSLDGPVQDDYGMLSTGDPAVAEKYGLQEGDADDDES